MDQTLLKVLSWVDTPTVCRAIEIASCGDGFKGFSKGAVMCSSPNDLPLVGYAQTLQVAASKFQASGCAKTRQIRKDYYRYLTQAPDQSILVAQDMEPNGAQGAYWGKINTMIHNAMGLCGVLTNGYMRDLEDHPENFPVISAGKCVNDANMQVVSFGQAVTLFGLTIRPGDLIHSDSYGAVVIPKQLIPELQHLIVKLVELEHGILKTLNGKSLDLDELEAAWDVYDNQLMSTSVPD